MAWWESFFDDRYLRIYGPLASPVAIARRTA